MVKISVDLMGGDNAPEEIEKGIIKAVKEDPSLDIKAYGLPGSFNSAHPQVEFIEVSERVESEDDPVKSVRRKKDSSLVRATKAVKDGEVEACVSAGNTGAIMAAGLFVVGRIKGVERPAIASILPSTNRKGMMLLDMGANSDNKPNHLYQFAVMASLYMEEIDGRPAPSVSLVNIGGEENKGNEVTKDAYQLLKDSDLNFKGNIETREILSGVADIAVTDGFTGNIVLKTIEGTAKSLMTEIKDAFMKNIKNKLAAAVLKKDVGNIRDLLDYRQYGGAPLLGLDGNVLKAHGSSDEVALYNAIKQAKRMAESDAIAKIKEKLGES